MHTSMDPLRSFARVAYRLSMGATADGDNEACTFTAVQPLTLTATSFATEECCDKFTIGSSDYSGTTGPDAVPMVPGVTIASWSSDGSINGAGWTICATGSSVSSPPPPPPSTSTFWTITSGAEYCQLSNGGACITDGPGDCMRRAHARSLVASLTRIVQHAHVHAHVHVHVHVTHALARCLSQTAMTRHAQSLQTSSSPSRRAASTLSHAVTRSPSRPCQVASALAYRTAEASMTAP